MGLAADIYQTYNWCLMVRERLERRGIRALVAPPYYWGISDSVAGFPGTFTMRESTFTAALHDIHACLRSWGFHWVLSFNAHGDSTHNRVYQESIKEVRDELGLEAYYVVPRYTLVASQEAALFFDSPRVPASMRGRLDVHAGGLRNSEDRRLLPRGRQGGCRPARSRRPRASAVSATGAIRRNSSRYPPPTCAHGPTAWQRRARGPLPRRCVAGSPPPRRQQSASAVASERHEYESPEDPLCHRDEGREGEE